MRKITRPFERAATAVDVRNCCRINVEQLKVINRDFPELREKLGEGEITMTAGGRAGFENYSIAYMIGLLAFSKLRQEYRGGVRFQAKFVADEVRGIVERKWEQLQSASAQEKVFLAVARDEDREGKWPSSHRYLSGTLAEIEALIDETERESPLSAAQAIKELAEAERAGKELSENDKTFIAAKIAGARFYNASVYRLNLTAIARTVIDRARALDLIEF